MSEPFKLTRRTDANAIYFRDDVDREVAKAVAAEREACAKLVENFKTGDAAGGITCWGEGLAAAIRARGG